MKKQSKVSNKKNRMNFYKNINCSLLYFIPMKALEENKSFWNLLAKKAGLGKKQKVKIIIELKQNNERR